MSGGSDEESWGFSDAVEQIIEATDRALAGRSPIIRDPLLIDNQGQRIPDEWRRNYKQRAADRLPGDVIVAFDRIHTLRCEKDRIQAEHDETKRKLERANLKIWIMSLIVSPIVTKLFTVLWLKIFP